MAAPLYNQWQVDRMLQMPKYVPFDAWETRWSGRDSGTGHRPRISAFPIDENDATEFVIESCHSDSRREVSFTLLGKLIGCPRVPLCRYESQIGRHKNPEWYPPEWVEDRVLHRHVHSERAIREGLAWCACADVIGPPVERIQQAIDHLTPIFLKELTIEIHDRDVRTGLFGR